MEKQKVYRTIIIGSSARNQPRIKHYESLLKEYDYDYEIITGKKYKGVFENIPNSDIYVLDENHEIIKSTFSDNVEFDDIDRILTYDDRHKRRNAELREMLKELNQL